MPENEIVKAAEDWTPRDHFVRATDLLLNGDVNQDYEVIALHIQLAAIPASNVVINDDEEDFRP